MKKQVLITLTSLLLSTGAAWAQVFVSGTVLDGNNEPVVGATVTVKGTTTGVITDASGAYTIQADENATLVISFLGAGTKEERVNGRARVDVVLSSSDKEIDEVIVVAYGITKREAKTGAVGVVSGSKINETPVVSMDKALGGKIAGVSITSNSGQPGAHSDIRIRGTSSINAGNNPLWVVDGIPVITSGDPESFLNTNNPIASINPNDIESITVLKDAAAASIYGSRAANGVILVTTKSGKEGRTSFTARAKFGTSWLANDNGFGIMNAEQLLDYQRAAVINAGGNPDNPAGTYYRPKKLLSDPLTNWMDHLTRMGTIQEYEINASGSNAKGKYYSSLDYNKTEGVFYGVDLERINGRLNADYKLTSTLETGARINVSYMQSNDVPMQSLYYSNPVFAGMMILPWTPAYDKEGNHNVGILENSNTNPRAIAQYDDQIAKSYQLSGNMYLQWKPIKQLTLKTTDALETMNVEGRRYWAPENNEGVATLQATTVRLQQLTTSNTATYDDVFGDHNVRLLVGQEASKLISLGTFNYAPDVNPDIPYVQTAPQSGVEGAQWYGAQTMLSFFGMLDYNYLEKYYLQASLRLDGSSLFGSESVWGTFYSVGLSWNLHKEDFLNSVEFVNLLKLRASYGLNGNNNISPYRAYGIYASTNYNGTAGMRPASPANPNLSWEKNGTWNVGLDFTLFENLDGNVDVYQRKTTDMLLDKAVPQTTGFSTNFLNIGSLQNKGVEIQLSYNIFNTNEFKWSVGGNVAFNKTKLLDLGDSEFIPYSEDSRLRHIVGRMK